MIKEILCTVELTFINYCVMSESKKYGLLLPGKGQAQPTFHASRNVFGDDSGSEDEANKKPVLLKPSNKFNRQGSEVNKELSVHRLAQKRLVLEDCNLAKVTQQKAVLEDPTVYQYDEIYDSMATQKEEKKVKASVEKKPKYIENLLKSANKRKIENERRIERQIQKEREKEGDEFADKEVFVTSAYKKKLEEMTKEEEREKREEYLESIGDVTKQRDLGGFYRHLYEQRLGSESEKKDMSKLKDPEPLKPKHSNNKQDKKDPSNKRNYRKRIASSDNKKLSEGEIESEDEEINRMNLEDIKKSKKAKPNETNIDADSDFSIDESSDEEDNKSSKVEDNNLQNTQHTEEKSTTPDPVDPHEPKVACKDEPKSELGNPPVQPKPKIDVWKKRTVGKVFEEALRRYYERKAARG